MYPGHKISKYATATVLPFMKLDGENIICVCIHVSFDNAVFKWVMCILLYFNYMQNLINYNREKI